MVGQRAGDDWVRLGTIGCRKDIPRPPAPGATTVQYLLCFADGFVAGGAVKSALQQ